MILIRPICLLVILLFAATNSVAFTTTTNIRGVVTSIEKMKKGALLVTFTSVWGFTRNPAEDGVTFSKQLWGHEHYFLDGKKSTFQDAIKVGHLVRIMADIGYYECYSTDYTFKDTVADSFGPDRGVYRLRLQHGGAMNYTVHGGKHEEPKAQHYKMDLYLHLLCKEGRVIAGASTLPIQSDHLKLYIPSLPVDTTKLLITDGRLQGHVTVSFLSSDSCIFPGESGVKKRQFDIDAPLGQAQAEGHYSIDDNEEKRHLTIEGKPEPIITPDRVLWLRVVGGTGENRFRTWFNQHICVNVGIKGGTVDHSVCSGFRKGGSSPFWVEGWQIDWDGPRFSGTITFGCDKPERTVFKGPLRIQGVLIGDRLFGSTHSDFIGGNPENAKLKGRLGGAILQYEAPPVVQWGERYAKKHLESIKAGTPLPPCLPVLPRKYKEEP